MSTCYDDQTDFETTSTLVHRDESGRITLCHHALMIDGNGRRSIVELNFDVTVYAAILARDLLFAALPPGIDPQEVTP